MPLFRLFRKTAVLPPIQQLSEEERRRLFQAHIESHDALVRQERKEALWAPHTYSAGHVSRHNHLRYFTAPTGTEVF